jgi:hypothetical protein
MYHRLVYRLGERDREKCKTAAEIVWRRQEGDDDEKHEEREGNGQEKRGARARGRREMKAKEDTFRPGLI